MRNVFFICIFEQDQQSQQINEELFLQQKNVIICKRKSKGGISSAV